MKSPTKSPTSSHDMQQLPHNGQGPKFDSQLGKRPSLASIAHDVIKNVNNGKAVNYPKCAGCVNCSSILTTFLEDCFSR